jgi:hypothetical protein
MWFETLWHNLACLQKCLHAHPVAYRDFIYGRWCFENSFKRNCVLLRRFTAMSLESSRYAFVFCVALPCIKDLQWCTSATTCLRFRIFKLLLNMYRPERDLIRGSWRRLLLLSLLIPISTLFWMLRFSGGICLLFIFLWQLINSLARFWKWVV